MKSGFALLACALIAGSSVAFAQQEDPHALVKSIITDTASEDEKLLGEMYSGELAEGESAVFSVQIDPAKIYRVYATCDFRCDDLDTIMFDKAGTIIDNDDGDDNAPILAVDPGDTGDQLNLHVEMQSCREKKCIWVLGVFEQL